MKEKLKKTLAVFLGVAVLSLGFIGCTQSKINTAKDVLTKADYYVTMAETMIVLAEDLYSANAKVVEAIECVKKSLITLKTAMKLVNSGLEKDYSKVATATIDLVQDITKLITAIEKASKS